MNPPSTETTAHTPSPAARAVPWPELLSPAGDWDCARAAVENGADAIYFGLDRHNARIRADNFTLDDLPRLMDFLHRRGVRGYVTFNTLIFADELAEAEATLRRIIAAGADAAIVQDIGICRLIRRLSPDFPIHASTQMTVTSAAGVAFARELGCELVVLARECTVQEIARIRASLRSEAGADQRPEMPLEVFVHGALCVAYSGQCLTSESLGGRSANRGECAQACRMPYELLRDGQPVPLGDRRYLLSPQDLAAVELLPDLVRAGVSSLKIEGRLKTPEYVANITRIYRAALDRLAGTPSAPEPSIDRRRYDMEMSFSRGLYTGWLGGINNQALVHGRFGKKRGVFLGSIDRIQSETVLLRLEGPLKPGDGVVFDAGRPEEREEGGRVYEVSTPDREGRVRLAFGQGDIDFNRIRPGNRIWKTSDPELEKRLRQTFAGDTPRFQRPLDFEVHGQAGVSLRVAARDADGNVAEACSTMPLTPAERLPLGPEKLREQLGRLGGTPFRLGTLTCRMEGQLMLPVSELNRLRREVVAQLEHLRVTRRRWHLHEPAEPLTLIEAHPDRPGAPADLPELVVLVRTLGQLEAVVSAGIRTIYCELEDPKRYRDAVQLVRAAGAGREQAPAIWVAPPRITKPGEDWILRQVQSSEADGYLVRTFDHLRWFGESRRIGDYTLNVANALTAEHLIRRHGLERVTASYDLNAAQLEALLESAPPAWFEITIHQHMPMFHMEHCLFCAFLTQGTDFTNCGRPCDVHDLKLRDRVGAGHPVKADAGCRNTVFNALAQTGAEFVGRMLDLGARRFRLEFLNETPGEVARTIGHYERLLRGEITGTQLWRELKLFNQLGVTRGTLGRSMGTVGSDHSNPRSSRSSSSKPR